MAFAALLILAFLAGILTFLTPCTLPMLPAYLSFATGDSARRSRVLRTLAFGVGVTIVFILFGVLAGTVGRVISANKRLIMIISGILLILLGILTLLEQSVPACAFHKHPSRSLRGAFLFGTIFAISWSGCTGPVLGFALILAANMETAIGGGLLLFAYALGLLLPLLLISLFLDRIPKGGRFWKTLKGTTLHIGRWTLHTTTLTVGVMLILLGILFLTGIGVWLSSSPIITTVFEFEERIAQALHITVST